MYYMSFDFFGEKVIWDELNSAKCRGKSLLEVFSLPQNHGGQVPWFSEVQSQIQQLQFQEPTRMIDRKQIIVNHELSFTK